MERLNNTLTNSELRNDLNTVLADSALMEGGTTENEPPVARRTSKTITRRKLTIIVSVAVFIGVIILVILIPALGLRKNA